MKSNDSHSKNLPALSEHTILRYFNFIALYVAQGIPEGMAFFGIPAWMAMNGKTPGEIGGFVAAVGLPWSFKIIVAPLMDRFSYLPMGRRRPWVLFGQLGLILSFIAMAFVPDPLNNLNLFMVAGFAVGFFGAFQDVATDGMAIDIVPINQQARANGFMWGAKIVGISGSLALGSWLLNKFGYSQAILMLSVAVFAIMFVPLFLRERPGEKLLPWSKGSTSLENEKMQITNWTEIFKSLFSVFLLRNSILMACVLFITQISFNFIATLLPVFTVQALCWTNLEYSQFFATASLIGGIGGMLIGGILIDKFGKIRMLNVYFFILIMLTTVFPFLSMYWKNYWVISSFMVIYQILYVFTSIGLFACAMEFCWKKISASQFTLYMTIANLGRIVGAKLLGPLKNLLSWEYTICSFGVMLALAWIIMPLIKINIHVKKIEELELKNA
ncbi:MAG: MFS transporter [Saprospiraceae bacterium]|uniref:MFS transporter n=1 Tax=Candidatus Defluviibacterium haderslevense TaxID=2981993 RepID=A0A9D7S902_9BACT|nr:MFS transporter [Candidatus Defluviibacterium haderslevense]